MKKLLLVATLSLFISNVASAKSIEGEGKFLSTDQDSVSFVKKQLLSNAFKKIIDLEIREMGLDSVTFWNNYNSKFEEHFSPIRTAVTEKYEEGEGDERKVPEAKKERLEKSLRKKRLVSKAKFGRLGRAIKSYSIKKLSKSIRMPNSHYINVSAQVNRKKLTDIYYKFIGISRFRTFRKLFLDVRYSLENTNWIELGVETEGDFVNVVNDHWQKKLTASAGNLFTDGVVIVDDSIRSQINERLKKPLALLRSSNVSLIDGDDSGMSDSLYMNVEVFIKKERADEGLKKLDIKFSGGLILNDLKDKSIITHLDFVPEKSSFKNIDQHTLSSNIASIVYRLPMTKIQKMRKIVEENVKNKNSFEIIIKGTKNVNEVFGFTKKLKEKGLLYYFNPKVETLIGSEVKVLVEYSGLKERALGVLTKMISEQVSQDRVVKRDSELPFVFNIVDQKNESDDSSTQNQDV
ncbi:MAG: hypothetical protein BM556_02025 [Bacteriovorax sp. MedPE-SWde]|nr:MAG: hypothetical protein BM556_02025 [Bacteriovorax sp. MedPE-SWde]